MDDLGRPIPGIKVLAQSKRDASSIISTQAAVDGRFQLAVEFGKYSLLAMDEKENYADCRLDLFSCNVQLVDVTPGSPAISIVVRGHKAARMHATIRDRSTGSEINGATILLRRGDNYAKAVTGSARSNFSLIVPADVDLVFSVSAYKYRTWTYRAPTTAYATFRVPPGQDTAINVEMVRIDP
jgi:hypothetical protein